MERRSTGSIENRIAIALLAGLFVMTSVRAALIPVTPPEAVLYNQFVGLNLQETLSANWANTPVLYTLLARVSTSAFHLTDFSLRLPSLLGALLYFWAAYRLAHRLLGKGSVMLAAVAGLSLNHLILDDLAMATGLGLALAFWLCSVELLLADRPNWAGVCAGLSLSASFSFLIPALLLGFLALKRRTLQEFGLHALVTGFLVLVIPLNHAKVGPIRVSRLEQPALFLIPVATIAVLGLVRRSPAKAAAWAAVAASSIYFLQFRPQHFARWPDYAGTRAAIKAIRQSAGPMAVRIAATPGLDQVLNYYRARYALGYWSVVNESSFDYALLLHQDDSLILRHHLHILWRDSYLTAAAEPRP